MNTRTAVAVAWTAIVAGCAVPPATVETAPAPSQAATADLLYRAVNLMESRKYDRAVAVLTGLVEQQPPADAGATHYLLGSAYAAVNDYASAATHYALAAAGPGRLVLEAATLAHLGAGHYAYRAGRYEDAVRHLAAWRRSATQTNPSTLMELAQAHVHIGQKVDALDVAEAALRAAQAQGEAVREEWLVLLAELYGANEQWDRSLAMHGRLEREFPVRRDRPTVWTPDTTTLQALEAQTRALLNP